MTHSIVWHRGHDACLFSDSIITGGSPPRRQWSSFGEPLSNARGQPVNDNGLKLVRTGNAVLTFAGVVDTWHDFLNVYKRCIRFGDNPRETFGQAARSLSPLGNPRQLAVAAAWHEDGCVSAVAFNADGAGNVCDIAPSSTVQLGSFSDDDRDNAEQFTQALESTFKLEAKEKWVLGLATLQLRAMTDALTLNGIGGALGSCRVLSDAIEWQPDIMYVMVQPAPAKPVFLGSVIARHDGLLVETTVGGGLPQAVMTTYSDGTKQLLSEWKKDGLRRIVEELGVPKRDYLVLLNSPPTSIVVVDMRKQSMTKNVELHGVRWKNGDTGFNISFSDKVYQALFARPPMDSPPGHRPIILEYVPFEPLTPEEVDALIRKRGWKLSADPPESGRT